MLKVFQGEHHADFLVECGKPAALLIHGFPGTPAEIRPLAPILNLAGWTTRGLFLPGFGAQIDSLVQRKSQEWIDAAVEALRSLQTQHFASLVVYLLIIAAPTWMPGVWLGNLLIVIVKHRAELKQPTTLRPWVKRLFRA